MARTAAAIVVGNEVLSGKVEDANGPYLARALRARGVDLRQMTVIPDEVEVIARQVRAQRGEVEVLFTSGGLGPTHDDVTVVAVAEALGRPVRRFAEIEERVRRRFGDRLVPEALRLADAPEGAAFLEVPGLWIPVLTVENVVLLPGVPELFRRQLDAVVERFRDEPFVLRAVYLGAHEVLFAARLEQVAARHPEVQIGSYPALGADYKVKVTLESRDAVKVEAALAELLASLPVGAVLKVE